MEGLPPQTGGNPCRPRFAPVQMNERSGVNRVREQYADWLTRYNWEDFITITYKSPRREPYYALKHAWTTLKSHGARTGFLVAEPHQTGFLHLHGLISGPPPPWRPPLELPWDIEQDLRKRYGISGVRPVREVGGASGYCAKYILKSQDTMDLYDVCGESFWWKNNLLTKGL